MVRVELGYHCLASYGESIPADPSVVGEEGRILVFSLILADCEILISILLTTNKIKNAVSVTQTLIL